MPNFNCKAYLSIDTSFYIRILFKMILFLFYFRLSYPNYYHGLYTYIGRSLESV